MAVPASSKLPAAAIAAATAAIAAWQSAPDQPAHCPVCGAASLTVVDRSARPYMAWFALSCTACGLDDILTYAMGGTGNSWS